MMPTPRETPRERSMWFLEMCAAKARKTQARRAFAAALKTVTTPTWFVLN